jgi:hypothetical protein
MKLPFIRRRDERTRGQAMVEFAIILPILAILMVMSLDLGRVFFGWVGMQNVARVAADFAAAHPDAFDPNIPASNPIKQQLILQYRQVIAREAAGLNCSPLPVASPPANIPAPVFNDTNGNTRYDLGEHVSVTLHCSFGLITPLAEGLLGGDVDVAAVSIFAIRGGMIAGVPIGSTLPSGSSSASASASSSASTSVDPSASGAASATPAPTPCQLPIANFSASPTSGRKTLTVTFNNTSQTFGCSVSGWVWDFGDGTAISTQMNPIHAYTQNGTYQVTLTVISPGGTASRFEPGYIHVCGNC